MTSKLQTFIDYELYTPAVDDLLTHHDCQIIPFTDNFEGFYVYFTSKSQYNNFNRELNKLIETINYLERCFYNYNKE